MVDYFAPLYDDLGPLPEEVPVSSVEAPNSFLAESKLIVSLNRNEQKEVLAKVKEKPTESKIEKTAPIMRSKTMRRKSTVNVKGTLDTDSSNMSLKKKETLGRKLKTSSLSLIQRTHEQVMTYLPEEWLGVYARVIEYFLKFNELPQSQQVFFSALMWCVGLTGFCIRVFGIIASFFLSLAMLSGLVLAYSFYTYIKATGLLGFMPKGLQNWLLNVSFFDILVNVFIYRRFSKMVIAVFNPFLKANSPEEAKQILMNESKVSPVVVKALFRKGIINNFPKSVKTVMLPSKKGDDIEDAIKSLTNDCTGSDSNSAKLPPKRTSLLRTKTQFFGKTKKTSFNLDDEMSDREEVKGAETKNMVPKKSTKSAVLFTSAPDNVIQSDTAAKEKKQEKFTSDGTNKESEKSTTGAAPQQTSSGSDSQDPAAPKWKQDPADKVSQPPLVNQPQSQAFPAEESLQMTNIFRGVFSAQELISKKTTIEPESPLINKTGSGTDSKSHSSGFKSDSEYESESSECLLENAQNSATETFKISSYARNYMKNGVVSAGAPTSVNDSASDHMSPMDLMMLGMRDPQKLMQTMMQMPMKGFFQKSIGYKQLFYSIGGLSCMFLLQLKYSMRTRKWTKIMSQALFFGFTFFGLMIACCFVLIKYVMQTRAAARFKKQMAASSVSKAVEEARPSNRHSGSIKNKAPDQAHIYLEDCE